MSGPPTEEERLARVALNALAEPGQVRMISQLLEHGPIALLQMLRERRAAGELQRDVGPREQGSDPAAALADAERRGLRFVIPGDPEWPPGLDDLTTAGVLNERGGPPVGLWVRGPLRLTSLAGPSGGQELPALAVVGSRAATTYGATQAAELACRVADAGSIVVSGGAFGIDAAAHRGVIAADRPTVVVLASGADRAYPVGNRQLIEHVAATGAVVSEAPPGSAPMRVRFLARNRIIAALTAGTVVVEAARRSGALNTAAWAVRLNRILMGLPGPVTSAASAGVHEQLRTGAMSLVTGADDVLELLGAAGEHLTTPRSGEQRPRDRLSRRQQQVLDAVPLVDPVAAESVARVAGVGVAEVKAALALLAEAGFVEQGEQGGWRLAVEVPQARGGPV